MNEKLIAAALLLLSAFLLYRNRRSVTEGGAYLIEQGAETVAQGEQAIEQVIESAIETGTEIMQKLTRGERNNNPGNIVKSDIFWRGEVPGNDNRFESFASPDEGIRAIGVIMQNYQRKYGLNTVRGLINRYAPPVENDTNSYVNAVAGSLGVSPDAALNLSDPAILLPLVKAIIKHENGRVIYADADIASALGYA